MSKKYLVVGATGLMGTTLVNQIPLNEDVTVIARRKLNYNRPVQFLNLDEDIKLPHADHLFICSTVTFEIIAIKPAGRSLDCRKSKIQEDTIPL